MLNTFKACIIRLCALAIKLQIIVNDPPLVIGASLYAWNIGRISCLNLMYPLKQALIVHRRKYLYIQFHPAIWWAHFLALIYFDDDSLDTSVTNFRTW